MRPLIALLLVLTAGVALRAEPPPVEELVGGAVARAEAVFSGRITYHLQTGFEHRGEISQEADYDFSFFDTSWALRCVTNGAADISHDGRSIEFGQSPQPDGKVDRGLHIDKPKTFRDRRPAPPTFAGSFWYPEGPLEFIEAHATEARVSGLEEVNGVRAYRLEWDVPKSQAGEAFHLLGPLIEDGGLLRVFVAPELGYAIPQLQAVSPDGVVSSSYDSRDFQDCGEGVFMPRFCKRQEFTAQGPTYFVEYRMSSIESINQPLPEASFSLEIPVGTFVDGIGDGGQQIGFRLEKVALSDAIPRDGSAPVVPEPFAGRKFPVLLVTVNVLLVVAVLFVYYRRRKSAGGE